MPNDGEYYSYGTAMSKRMQRKQKQKSLADSYPKRKPKSS